MEIMGRFLFSSLFLAALGSLAVAQQQKPPDAKPASPEELTAPIARTGVREVLAPTVVIGKDGSFVDDLRPSDFRLFDNGVEQKNIRVETTSLPISMVVAIQANGGTTGVLPKLRRIGPMVEQLLLGENGEAALLAFDHRTRVIQDFTHDGTAFNRALEKLNPGSSGHSLIDAVQESVRMLNRRPKESRKVILLISEVRDQGSQGKLREVLTNAEFGNITVYTVSVSRLTTELSGERVPPRQSAIPPAASMGTLPGPMAPTPLSIEQVKGVSGTGTSVDFVPVIKDILVGVKTIFVDSPADVLTTYTGGKKYEFYREKGLDKAFQQISGELHREYLLSYSPVGKEGGYHEIVVQVQRPSLQVRTRPGYWYGGDVPQ